MLKSGLVWSGILWILFYTSFDALARDWVGRIEAVYTLNKYIKSNQEMLEQRGVLFIFARRSGKGMPI